MGTWFFCTGCEQKIREDGQGLRDGFFETFTPLLRMMRDLPVAEKVFFSGQNQIKGLFRRTGAFYQERFSLVCRNR